MSRILLYLDSRILESLSDGERDSVSEPPGRLSADVDWSILIDSLTSIKVGFFEGDILSSFSV